MGEVSDPETADIAKQIWLVLAMVNYQRVHGILAYGISAVTGQT